MLGLAFLLSAVAPHQGLIRASDYPAIALARNEQGSVLLKLVIRPDGVPDTCAIVVSSKFKDLDDATCKIVMARARFVPAAADGKPLYQAYEGVINWAIDRLPAPLDNSDFELTVNQAPSGISLPAKVKITFMHGADGKVGRCSADEQDKDASPVLVDLACKFMRESPAEPIHNRDGVPVDAMDMATVKFSLQK